MNVSQVTNRLDWLVNGKFDEIIDSMPLEEK